jgi:amino acid transporter
VTSGLLLLAAAASSFQAGPGLLKALAQIGPGGEEGVLPRLLGRTNEHHTPVAAVGLYAVISAAIILVASGQEQELVLVYAVAVFVSFLAGLLAMARFSHRRGKRLLTVTNLVGAVGVTFTLLVNLTGAIRCSPSVRPDRGDPLLALGSERRPRGIEAVEREAEDPLSRDIPTVAETPTAEFLRRGQVSPADQDARQFSSLSRKRGA